jgi:hypothetical protein
MNKCKDIVSIFKNDSLTDPVSELDTLKVGDVTGGDYSEFEEDGTLIKYGDATTWTDFSVAAISSKRGSNDKPDYDFTNIGLLFPQNNTTEKVYLSVQMDHRKKMDSDISFHFHYIQSEVTQPTFTIEYKFYNNGALVPGSWTTLNTSDEGGSKGLLTYPGSGDMMQIGEFPLITPPSPETVSANLDVIMYRDDNDISGDILVKYIDFHYEIDSDGSREEYAK